VAKVVAISIEHVEDGIVEFGSAFLQQLEARNCMAIESDHLTVQEQSTGRKSPEVRCDTAVNLRPVEFVSGKKRDSRSFFVSQDTYAVVLLFVDPAWVLEGFFC